MVLTITISIISLQYSERKTCQMCWSYFIYRLHSDILLKSVTHCEQHHTQLQNFSSDINPVRDMEYDGISEPTGNIPFHFLRPALNPRSIFSLETKKLMVRPQPLSLAFSCCQGKCNFSGSQRWHFRRAYPTANILQNIHNYLHSLVFISVKRKLKPERGVQPMHLHLFPWNTVLQWEKMTTISEISIL